MKRHLVFVVALVVVVGVVGATVLRTERIAVAAESKVPVDDRLIAASTNFGLGLFNELLAESKGKNVFISPASVSIALSMTYNGASGKTREAMAKTLALNGMSLDDLNNANGALIADLRGPGQGVELAIANSLWAREGVKFKNDFMARNSSFYRADVETLNFGDASAVPTINSWVSKNTGGKIDKIIDRIEPATILFLINAVYFKGTWTDRFDPAKTRPRNFTLLDSSKKHVQMMSRQGDYDVLDGQGFRAIKLPYGQRRWSMLIFLPETDSSLSAFCKKLNAANWAKWRADFRETHVQVSLPKFRIEYSAELNSALTALGMGVAFDPVKADFSAMCPILPGQNVFIGKVAHKTFVDVNEEGTEAAAVTNVPMAAGVAIGGPDFIVDRPFFCAIVDGYTGAIVFAGAIVDPTQ